MGTAGQEIVELLLPQRAGRAALSYDRQLPRRQPLRRARTGERLSACRRNREATRSAQASRNDARALTAKGVHARPKRPVAALGGLPPRGHRAHLIEHERADGAISENGHRAHGCERSKVDAWR